MGEKRKKTEREREEKGTKENEKAREGGIRERTGDIKKNEVE